jgi:hypothetical protein
MERLPTPADPQLAPARQRVIAELCEHFAADHLSDTQLEERIDRAHRASEMVELRSLLADLPVLAAEPRASLAATERREVPAQQTVVAVMAGASRRGAWTVARRLHVFAVMGEAKLDLREAVFGPGETEILVFAMMGGIEIVVPPDVAVEVSVVPLMAGVDQRGDPLRGGAADAPRIHVKGIALMGAVDVQIRLPGESAREARERRRLERAERKRLP